jgi:hypothetical protein
MSYVPVVGIKFIVPVADQVIPATKVNPPYMLIVVAEPAKVPAKSPATLVKLKVAHVIVVAAAVVTVTTPEFKSNIALSTDVGTDAPLAPPEVADQLAVLVVSHVAVPPTQ